MNVRIVADQLRRPIPGGIGTYVRGLAQGLRELKTPGISLWASRPPRGDRLPELGFPVINSVFPSRVLSRLWGHGLNGDSPHDVDVVHATSFVMPPTSLPLTVMVHDTAWRDHPEAYPVRGREWHETGLRRAIDQAAALLTPSPHTQAALREAGARQVYLVAEGVDHLAPADPLAARTLLEGLGVSGSFVLAVGTLEPRKNLARLVEAYTTARLSLPLIVVGQTGWGEQLIPVDGVVFAGKVSNAVLSALYEACAFFVSVPLSEGFGLPAVEAMAMGAPVISSSVPSVGDAAYEVNPLDVDAIASAMVELAENQELRNRLRAHGAERAAQLTWRNVAQQHLEIWERVHHGQ